MATRKTADTTPTVPPSSAPQEAYCVKCKTKRVIKDPHEAVTNGRRMLKGTCPVCGTNMNRILGKA
jgi:hypothetical protein